MFKKVMQVLDSSSVRSLGLAPAGDGASSSSLREGADFAALQAQIDRLTDLHAGQMVEWPVVVQLASAILKDIGKDLAVGTWLTLGLFHQRGPQGLADGVRVLHDLVATWWEEMSPPAARLRGRRNQMQWLLDRLMEALDEQALLQMDPMPADQHAQLLADWDALDAAWQAHDDDAPAFYGLAAVFRRLPVQNDSPSEDTSEAGSSQAAPAREAVQVAQAASVAAEPVSTSRAPAPGMATTHLPETGADAVTAVESALTGLHPLVAWLVQEHPTSPMLFRLNRFCAWAALETLPATQGRTTRLPFPGQVFDAYEHVIEGGDPIAVIRFAESRLVSQPYWLDLNRVSHSALTQLGATQAAQALAHETVHFMNRLSGLEELSYSDGRAFADPATQAWLAALREADTAAPAGGVNDEVGALTREAEAQAVAGRLAEALDDLQSAIQRAGSRRACFRLRLAQCHLIHRFDAQTDIRPMVEPLVEEAETRDLGSWEPDLARQALELAAGLELRHGAASPHPVVPMLGRLSRVDVNAAWQLSKTTAD